MRRVLTALLGPALILSQAALCLADKESGPAPRSPVHDTDRVLVVRNENSLVSKAWPMIMRSGGACGTSFPCDCQDSAANSGNETISFAAYEQSHREAHSPIPGTLHANIDFIVLTKGIPIRIADAPGRGAENRRPSLDSYLAALDYDKAPGAASIHLRDGGFSGTAWANRFWNSSTPFAHAKFGGYLVTRLDGYTEADAKALTTRALAAERQAGKSAADGKVLLDTCPAFGYADRKHQPRARNERLGGARLQRCTTPTCNAPPTSSASGTCRSS